MGRSGDVAEMRYRVVVPAKPQPKARARVGKNGRVHTPKQTVVAEAWVRMCVVEAVGTPRLEGPVAMRATFVMPVPRTWSKAKQSAALRGEVHPVTKPDWDNLAKMLSDALNGIAWQDDAVVVRAEVVKRYGPEPCTIVEWEGLGARQDAPGEALLAELV